MKFEEVLKKVKNVPYINEENAQLLYEFIIENKPALVLELGIGHGTSSCYIAAALEEIGQGKLICVDLLDAKDFFSNPSIEDQLRGLNLSNLVEIYRMKSGYNWFLHDEIKACSEDNGKPCKTKYDLIIDGPKNWTIDSSSFFLCDKLLNKNGWIIWDDYNWTYFNENKKRAATDGISHRSLSEDELITPHIREIFHLLVMQHPHYGEFSYSGRGGGVWVWARKLIAT